MPIHNEQLLGSHILIIDDNQMNLEVVEATLDSAGYTHITGLSKPQNLAQLMQQERFDLVLLDINMPIMNGFAVLDLFTSDFTPEQCPPIIMLTAQHDVNSRVRALEAGASDYVVKPFNRTELLKRILIHLENWHLKRRLKQENQQLEQKVLLRTKALEAAQLEMIYRLGRAAEYRDNETGNHVKRVSLLAKRIAEQAGMPRDFCELIAIASPMHDIGKIGVSDTILLKPGKLTDEEFLIMQDHVKIGAEILENANSSLIQMAREIALTHHEKYNGKGYPHGLKGENIPISGRIVAIADVFDALTSKRPYKRAWRTEDAINLIIREKGEHFDPHLVDIFVTLVPELDRLFTGFRDE